MGLNFDDYPSFQPKIAPAQRYATQKVFSIRVGKIYEHPSVFLFPLTNLDF